VTTRDLATSKLLNNKGKAWECIRRFQVVDDKIGLKKTMNKTQLEDFQPC
jgi:hypothetical protein